MQPLAWAAVNLKEVSREDCAFIAVQAPGLELLGPRGRLPSWQRHTHTHTLALLALRQEGELRLRSSGAEGPTPRFFGAALQQGQSAQLHRMSSHSLHRFQGIRDCFKNAPVEGYPGATNNYGRCGDKFPDMDNVSRPQPIERL